MSEQPIDYTENRDELNELMAIRRDKLQALINQGIDPMGENLYALIPQLRFYRILIR